MTSQYSIFGYMKISLGANWKPTAQSVSRRLQVFFPLTDHSGFYILLTSIAKMATQIIIFAVRSYHFCYAKLAFLHGVHMRFRLRFIGAVVIQMRFNGPAADSYIVEKVAKQHGIKDFYVRTSAVAYHSSLAITIASESLNNAPFPLTPMLRLDDYLIIFQTLYPDAEITATFTAEGNHAVRRSNPSGM